MSEPRSFKIVDYDEEKGNLKVTDLRLITGGKEPPATTGNWLKDLELGTVFFCQDRSNHQDFSLGLFWLIAKNGANSKVVVLRSPKVEEDIPVDPIRFCNRYNLFHVEALIKLPEDPKDPKDLKEEEDKDNLLREVKDE